MSWPQKKPLFKQGVNNSYKIKSFYEALNSEKGKHSRFGDLGYRDFRNIAHLRQPGSIELSIYMNVILDRRPVEF